MKKVYSIGMYKSTDERLIPRVQISDFIYEAHKAKPEDEFIKHEWKSYYKRLCNDIRRAWDIEGIISVIYSEKENCVVVVEFPIKADNFIFSSIPMWDEQECKYYIEVECTK